MSSDGADLLVALEWGAGRHRARKPDGGFETPMLLPGNAGVLAATDVDNDGDADP
ncbi:MAG: hypothetical protein R2699_09460 [Acidimicrobiales bacterium]